MSSKKEFKIDILESTIKIKKESIVLDSIKTKLLSVFKNIKFSKNIAILSSYDDYLKAIDLIKIIKIRLAII